MNIELLEGVKAEIEANRECFDYHSWEHCIAGITCRVGGLGIDRNRAVVFVPDFGPMTYPDAARHLLGLSNNEARALFVFWPLAPLCQISKRRNLAYQRIYPREGLYTARAPGSQI